MALLRIDRLAPGMVLEDDVRDQSGRMLLLAGCELTEKHLTVMKSWGIAEVAVCGDAEEAEAAQEEIELDPATVEAVHRSVKERFATTPTDHPAMAELLRLCIERGLQRARRGQSA